MRRDAFSGCHPGVCFLFFLGALGFGMVILHPAYLLVGLLGALSYHLVLFGRKGLGRLGLMAPVLLGVALLNPLINRSGQTVLFTFLQIPYTLEALIYGAVLSGMLLTMLLWFGCLSAVLTGDRIVGLFGGLAPSLSLLLVMILRLVPDLIRRGRQITGARRSIGKGELRSTNEAMTVLGCLTSWALEGGIVTADSMRARGYGATKRSSFSIHRMVRRDKVLTLLMLILALVVTGALAAGHTSASFTPEWHIAPISPIPLCVYGTFTLIPTILDLQEALSWHISKSKI